MAAALFSGRETVVAKMLPLLKRCTRSGITNSGLTGRRTFVAQAMAPSATPKKATFSRDKDHCNIGTIGHHSHGKTTLTAALTKILGAKQLADVKGIEDLDSTPDEKKKGMGMNFHLVSYSTGKRHYGHTDCPGHSEYAKNMIVGANRMDGAILVVDSAKGPMAQTREHLLLAKHIGVQDIVVFLNKVETTDKETTELVEMELRNLLTEVGFNGDTAPVVAGSALCALQGNHHEIGEKKLLELLDAIDEHIKVPARDLEKPFLLPIENVFGTPQGTVALGRLERGVIQKGSEVEIIGYDRKVKSVIPSFEMFFKSLEEARAGDSVSALLRGVKRDDIKRGMALVKPGSASAHDQCEARVYCLKKEEGGRDAPLPSLSKAMLFARTFDCLTQLVFTNDNDDLMIPGKDNQMTLKLMKPMAIEEGLRFVIRDGRSTIGTGVITKMGPDLSFDEKKQIMKGKTNREKEAAKKKTSE